jgi:hypothetical protein
MVIAPRATATAPTPVVGCFAIAATSGTFGVKSPLSIMLRNIPKVSIANGS